MSETGWEATIWMLSAGKLTRQTRMPLDEAMMEPRRVAGPAFKNCYPEFFMSSRGKWWRMGPDGDWRTSSLTEAAETVFQ